MSDGGMCWYCYWGWSKPVADIYQKALEKLDELQMQFGPGHIVWGDENFDDDSISFCLKLIKDGYTNEFYTKEDIEIVRKSLEQLAAVPLSIRCPEPEDYDDQNLQNFPPLPGIEMVKV